MWNNNEVIGVIGGIIGECMHATDSYIPDKLKVYKDNALPIGPVLNYKSKKVVETFANVNCPYIPLKMECTPENISFRVLPAIDYLAITRDIVDG